MSENSEALTEFEFIDRFAAHCIKTCGFTHFDDGTSVDQYAREVAASYWSDPLYREDGPEACAESDMDYWGES